MDEDEKDLERRRSELGAKLAERQAQKSRDMAKEKQGEVSRKGYAEAMKLASEFFSAVFVGGVLGYMLDRFAGTSPWGLVVLLLLGFCAGVLNVLRSVGAVAPVASSNRRDEDNK
ncbi:AtpZ/AtpI family protein [Allorhizobium sp. BGMRC 0089]|uniref:AtpZ/AtpI family protein n=1 Tax=Allorhizobium sonneratiae TaxID=2934936 RepID=UPI0020339974|nr:AtpZ/AtpI family protein [Allorhizobium sonneratiae]MCM2291303.1 AtpZ/AtpI family protein [Allorhizobium sonneratiae]